MQLPPLIHGDYYVSAHKSIGLDRNQRPGKPHHYPSGTQAGHKRSDPRQYFSSEATVARSCLVHQGKLFLQLTRRHLTLLLFMRRKLGSSSQAGRETAEKEKVCSNSGPMREHNSGHVCASLIPFDLAENCELSCSAQIFTRA